MNRPIYVCITGGPLGGKSAIKEHLQKVAFGKPIGFITEVATELLKIFPVPGRDVTMSPEWQHLFQEAVHTTQRNAEMAWRLHEEKGVFICDRGIADGIAYMGDVEAFLNLSGYTLEEVYARYDLVIHLETLAVSNPELYLELVTTNPSRYEKTPEEAIVVEKRLAKAWENHPNRAFIQSSLTLEEKKQTIADLIRATIAEKEFGDKKRGSHVV